MRFISVRNKNTHETYEGRAERRHIQRIAVKSNAGCNSLFPLRIFEQVSRSDAPPGMSQADISRAGLQHWHGGDMRKDDSLGNSSGVNLAVTWPIWNDGGNAKKTTNLKVRIG